jgi:hypothetical protein
VRSVDEERGSESVLISTNPVLNPRLLWTCEIVRRTTIVSEGRVNGEAVFQCVDRPMAQSLTVTLSDEQRETLIEVRVCALGSSRRVEGGRSSWVGRTVRSPGGSARPASQAPSEHGAQLGAHLQGRRNRRICG